MLYTAEYPEFLRAEFEPLVSVLTTAPPQFEDSEAAKLRHTVLEVLARLPHNDAFKPYAPRLAELCVAVLRSDGQANALLALKTFCDLHRNFRQAFEPQLAGFFDFVVQVRRRWRRRCCCCRRCCSSCCWCCGCCCCCCCCGCGCASRRHVRVCTCLVCVRPGVGLCVGAPACKALRQRRALPMGGGCRCCRRGAAAAVCARAAPAAPCAPLAWCQQRWMPVQAHGHSRLGSARREAARCSCSPPHIVQAPHPLAPPSPPPPRRSSPPGVQQLWRYVPCGLRGGAAAAARQLHAQHPLIQGARGAAHVG